MSAPLLHLDDFVPAGGLFHLARVTYTPATPRNLHRHDFAEVFWIEYGRGWHWINSRRLPLQAGDLMMIRPADVHAFAAEPSLTLVNVAFQPRHLSMLKRRYLTGDYQAGEGDALPARTRLGAEDRRRLEQWAATAPHARQRLLDLHAFLLDVLRLLHRPMRFDAREAHPPWLTDAVAAMVDPKLLREGVRALARLAGRTPEHVNRTSRRCLGRSATELLNHLRMEHVGWQLRMSGRPILELAAEVGLTHVSYFYRLFRAHFGISPWRYRARNQSLADRIIGRPRLSDVSSHGCRRCRGRE